MNETADPAPTAASAPARIGEVVLRARGVTRTFSTPAGDVHALGGVDLDLRAGELLVVQGRSGAGKTTLLNVLGGLDEPTSGTVAIEGRDLRDLDADERLRLRTERVAFVLQTFGLVPVLSAAENVEVPLRLLRVAPRERAERVREALEVVGLGAHGHQRPDELSGGQQQRVGIARALVCRPRILFADEPTGQLDSGTAGVVMALIRELTHAQNVAALVSTHDAELMASADRVVTMHDGAIVAD